MDSDTGYVVTLRGEQAVIRLLAGDQCDECGCQGSCASHGAGARQILIQNSLGAREGDKVQIR